MKELILTTCRKHGISIVLLDTNQSVSNMIIDIENMLINRRVFAKDPRQVMAELWKIEQGVEKELLHQKTSFRDNMEAILSSKLLLDDGDYLKGVRFISCSVIQSFDTVIILNDKQRSRMIELGYGIKSYRVRKNETIREVYCTGSHPNLNQFSKQFCLDDEFLSLELSVANIYLLEELLSQFNITNCYIPYDQKKLIEEVISDR